MEVSGTMLGNAWGSGRILVDKEANQKSDTKYHTSNGKYVVRNERRTNKQLFHKVVGQIWEGNIRGIMVGIVSNRK